MKIVFRKFNMRLAGLGIFLCLSVAQVASSYAQKKNLLFIITDQQRYDAMGVAGNTMLKTPNLDRLADEGAYFKNAYTPCAVCGPARSSILTGHSIESTGVLTNNQTYKADPEVIMTMPTFDEVLNANGYDCEYYGKWHAVTSKGDVYNNSELESSYGRTLFDSGGKVRFYWDYLAAAAGPTPAPGDGEFTEDISKWPYIANPLDKFYGKTQAYVDALSNSEDHSQPDQHGVLQLASEHTITAVSGRETMEALERLKDKTFSLTCSFHFPHTPMTPTAKYFDMYPVDAHVMPASINDDMANSPYFKSNSRDDETAYADPAKLKYMMSEYYALITEIDDWVGAILNKLDDLGLAENTLVIFTSDHGEMLGAHGMREKNVFLEESAHVPLLIKFPEEVPEKTTVNGYVSNVDLFSTILDYLEIPNAPTSQGKSLRGLIEGTDALHGKYVVTEWGRDGVPGLMVLKDGWKLMIPHKASSTVINAMYDLNTDPHEMNNLLGTNPDRAQYQVKAEELRANLLEWLTNNNSAHYNDVVQRDLLNGGAPSGNDASFVSQVIPPLEGGSPITVSVTMKNTGTTNWTSNGNYKLGSQSPEDNTIWGLNRVPLSAGESIAPNSEKTFTFDVNTPSQDGSYIFQWQMLQEGKEWFGSLSEAEPFIVGVDPNSYWDDADAMTGWGSGGGSNLSLDTTIKKQGVGALKYVGAVNNEFRKTFSTPHDAQGTAAGTVLSFWYYVSDPTLFTDKNQVEISSTGNSDNGEYHWSLNKNNLIAGWNFIKLNVADADISVNVNNPIQPDLSAMNWFRIYREKTGTVTTRIDAIQLIGENGLSVDGFESQKSFKMYPNPATTEIYLDIAVSKSSQINVTFFDILGKVVSQPIGSQVINSGKHNFRIPVEDLETGIYFAKITMNQKTLIKKIVIK